MRVCLINDSARNPNWGCRATSTALRSSLEESGHQVVATVYLEELLGLTLDDRRSWRRARERWERFVPKRPIVRELLGRAFAENVYPQLNLVTFRESLSAAGCSDYVTPETSKVMPDMVFTYSPSPRDNWLKLAVKPGQFDVWPDHAAFGPPQPYAVVGLASTSDHFRADCGQWDSMLPGATPTEPVASRVS